ncbi:ferredoxin [Mycobacterium sp. SMC-4]|uniref:ferredoxin n=1 Tax=Mycobacterium sp. SMC-4 TaxID=2857059 RepID=UPI0021B2D12A|nr:(4Fe-4S)-binding protein [Mycobacterium sp. SMC-4]UXA18969.1 (4Fe-4S)-binding protein [Mycobacterium sp. SMC-4]
MRIIADREVCMSAGMCVMTAGEFFDQDAGGSVVLMRAGVPDDIQARVRLAVGLCPSGALQVLPA